MEAIFLVTFSVLDSLTFFNVIQIIRRVISKNCRFIAVGKLYTNIHYMVLTPACKCEQAKEINFVFRLNIYIMCVQPG